MYVCVCVRPQGYEKLFMWNEVWITNQMTPTAFQSLYNYGTLISEDLASENKNGSCDNAIWLAIIFKIANHITLYNFRFLVSCARSLEIGAPAINITDGRGLSNEAHL